MSFFLEKFTIKGLEIPRFIGAPLDGITDSPFRKLVRDFSKEELLYTEMRHVRSVVTPKGGALALNFEQFERPLNFQFAANSTEFVESACERVLRVGVDAIDLNIGCPARNVVSSGGGSSLMADPERLEGILKEFRRFIPQHIPFTLKMRAGFKIINAVDIAKLAQDCGVDAITIHPRLQTQMFSGQPNYQVAALVKQAVQIPVVFSGNIINFKTAKMTYEKTGVDGFLIGRGMWAKPWKFEEIKANAAGKEYVVDGHMILRVALRHLELMVAEYGSHGLLRFRKNLPFYIKGHPSASELRQRLVQSDNLEDVQKGLIEFLG
ncbi:tRNA-dihydrouridine synthase [Candidatus Dependentiae bacterium]|nr:tRNA-dihydrouridine synthase [Candidatus Dependentiae bacterium]